MPNQSVPTRHKIESNLFISSLSAFTLIQRLSELIEQEPELNNSFLVRDEGNFVKFSIAGLEQVGEIRFNLDDPTVKNQEEFKGIDLGTQFVTLDYRVGDKHLVRFLLQKLKRYLTKFELKKKAEEPERFMNIPMFFLSLRAYHCREFIITESAIESARYCTPFDDASTAMGIALGDLQFLSTIPGYLGGVHFVDGENSENMHKIVRQICYYQDAGFNKKHVLHYGKKHVLDSRFIINFGKGKNQLQLHVKWLKRARKHLIGFIEEIPPAE